MEASLFFKGPGAQGGLAREYAGTLASKSNPQYDASVKLTFDGQRSDFVLGLALKDGGGGGWAMIKLDSRRNLAAGIRLKLSEAVTAKLWSSVEGFTGFSAGVTDRLKVGLGIECDL